MRGFSFFISHPVVSGVTQFQSDPQANRQNHKWASRPNNIPALSIRDAFQQYVQQEMRNASGNFSGGVTAAPADEPVRAFNPFSHQHRMPAWYGTMNSGDE